MAPSLDRPNILIAGVGNVLKGDDGFGVRVIQILQSLDDLPPEVKLLETGIGGMSLIQELMLGYHALILIDAYSNSGPPGKLYLLEPEIPDLSDLSIHEKRDYFADTHYATPIRALSLVNQISKVPPILRIIGCEPENLDELNIGLSPSVEAALDEAVKLSLDVAREILIQSNNQPPSKEN